MALLVAFVTARSFSRARAWFYATTSLSRTRAGLTLKLNGERVDWVRFDRVLLCDSTLIPG